jgi:hypothetical protein
MAARDKSCYPLVWFTHGGWWFKAFDQCFGPYAQPQEARHNLLVIQRLCSELRNELERRRIPS